MSASLISRLRRNRIMSGNPLISVIVATNRDSPFLVAALETVAEQSYGNWELLVVDNGVPDRAALRQKVSCVPGARVIETRPLGLGFARNVGVLNSAGEFLVFHDDDDVWDPRRLELQLHSFDERPEAGASWVGGWHMDAAGKRFGPAFPARPTAAADILRGIGRTPPLCGTLMVRREAHLAMGGFSPELPIMEDFEYMLRLLMLYGTMACVPDELLLGYRRHDGNMTNTGWRNRSLRRFVMEQSIDRLRWSAQMRGDLESARLLDENLMRFHRQSAGEAGEQFAAELRRRQLREGASDLWWGARKAPSSFWSGASRRALGRMR